MRSCSACLSSVCWRSRSRLACGCEQCRAIDNEEGSEAGPWIRLCNEAAAEINKEFPGFLVETLAYQYTRHPPALTKPSEHVLVRLCSIECDFSHPLSGESNKSFGDDLRGWAKIAPNLFIWNYVTNFGDYLIPHPNLTPLGADLRFFVDSHAVGVLQPSALGVKTSAGDLTAGLKFTARTDTHVTDQYTTMAGRRRQHRQLPDPHVDRERSQ